MPSFSYDDRMMLDAESRLWAVLDVLKDIQCGAFQSKVNSLRESAESLTKELRDYNNQFETDDEGGF